MALTLPTGIDFRLMAPGDIDAVLAIIGQHDEDDYEMARQAFANGGGDQFVLTAHDEVVGTTGASYADGTDATYWLSWTYLDEVYRGRGLGSVMLETMVDQLRTLEARKVFVNVSDYVDMERGSIYEDAMRAYERAGFVEELRHRDYYDRNESLIVLGMRLAPEPQASGTVTPDQRAGRLVDCGEIPDTEDAYLIDWEFTEGTGSTDDDVREYLSKIAKWEGRVVFVSASTEATRVMGLLRNNGFFEEGRLRDFYEDGMDDIHFRYDY